MLGNVRLRPEMASPPSQNPPGTHIAGDHDQLVTVYVRTMEDTERLAAHSPGTAYYGEMEKIDRQKAVKDQVSKAKDLFATTAFAQGIDLPRVSLVVHLDFPVDLMTYYQDVGCAGRDGGPAEAVMIYNTA